MAHIPVHLLHVRKITISTSIVRSQMRPARLTSGRSPFDNQPYPTPWRSLFQVLQYACRTEETAHFSAFFAYKPRHGHGSHVGALTPPGTKHALINHVRPASTGDVLSSISFPCRHRPASKRRLSRAPRPASWTGDLARRRVTSTVCGGGMDI